MCFCYRMLCALCFMLSTVMYGILFDVFGLIAGILFAHFVCSIYWYFVWKLFGVPWCWETSMIWSPSAASSCLVSIWKSYLTENAAKNGRRSNGRSPIHKRNNIRCNGTSIWLRLWLPREAFSQNMCARIVRKFRVPNWRSWRAQEAVAECGEKHCPDTCAAHKQKLPKIVNDS